MDQQPRIITLQETLLAGMRMTMSFTEDKTYALWRGFMPRRKEILNSRGIDLYSVEVYPRGFFDPFDLDAPYEKWAAIEVNGTSPLPEGMEHLVLPTGLYAVFIHRGPASEGPATYSYIFGTWLPRSGYELDQRPHFAKMGEKYMHDDPHSEEEIWIPVILQPKK